MNRLYETKFQPDDPLITAFALGELEGEEHARVAAAVAGDPLLATAVAEIRATSAQLSAALASEPLPIAAPSPADEPLNGNVVALTLADMRSHSSTDREATTTSASDDAHAQNRREPWRRQRKIRPFPYFLITSLAAACFVVVYIVFDREHERREALRLADLKERQDIEDRINRAITLELRPGEASLVAASLGAETRNASGENSFLPAEQNPRSSFPIRVGTASFADVRRYLDRGQRPPRAAVRIEEMVNFFAYDYAPPATKDAAPFSAALEVASAPWAVDHRLVRIGLRAREAAGDSTAAIAKDVSVQVEFNPAQVQAYRLIGYENRSAAKDNFNEANASTVDINAGQIVTVLYDIVPVGVAWKPEATVDALKYQTPAPTGTASASANPQSAVRTPQSTELLTVTLRYKLPESDTSTRVDFPLVDRGTQFAGASPDFKFAAAVASFGMLLRDSPNKGAMSFATVLAWAEQGRGTDAGGYRSEFLGLVGRTGSMRQ